MLVMYIDNTGTDTFTLLKIITNTNIQNSKQYQ